jgi:hypothetical protein
MRYRLDLAQSARLCVLMFGCSFGSACSGVAPGAVRDTTSTITAQVALAKASLVGCRGGDRGQCDSAAKNLDTIASSNAQLDQLAGQ